MLVRSYSNIPSDLRTGKDPSGQDTMSLASCLHEHAASSAVTSVPTQLSTVRSRTRRFVAANSSRLPQLEATESKDIIVQEVDSGLTNFNFQAFDKNDPNKTRIFIKHAEPFLSKFPDRELFVERQDYEVRGICAAGQIIPDVVPRVLLYDEQNAMLVTQFLSGYSTLTSQLRNGDIDSTIAGACGDALGKLHGSSHISKRISSGDSADEDNFRNDEHLELMSRFILNDLELVIAESNATSDMSDRDIRLCQAAAMELRKSYLEKKECLIHADLHSGNIMVEDNAVSGDGFLRDMKILDWEKICYGPAGFDLGLLWSGYHWYHMVNPSGFHYLRAVMSSWESYAAAFSKEVGRTLADVVLPGILAEAIGYMGFWNFFMVSPRGGGEGMFPVGFEDKDKKSQSFRAIEAKALQAISESATLLLQDDCKHGINTLSNLFQKQ